MGLLSDKDIQAIGASNLITTPPGTTPLVRGAAIELSVGDIFTPGVGTADPGSPGAPLSELCLLQGQTAVIRTMEQLTPSQDYAAIAFAAFRMSLQGLLMTNSGYVDPGYKGPLHVTVINMGKEPFCLKRGDRLLRCLFFRLDSRASNVFPTLPSPIDGALLRRLSKDFVNVEERAATVARRAVDRGQLMVPLLVGALGILGTFGGTYFAGTRATEARFAKLEATCPNAQQLEAREAKLEALLPLEQRMDALEITKVRDLDERIRRLETSQRR